MQRAAAVETCLQRAVGNIDGERLGGLITAAVGVSLGVFLYFITPGRPVYLVGGIPFMVGLVLLAHSIMISRPRS